MTLPARRHLVVGLAVLGIAVPSAAGAASLRARLPTKTVEVNGVTVAATPKRINERGATIKIALDTHQGSLDVNLRKKSTLRVDRTQWPVASFRGDGPGGHHREGTLRFDAEGPATGKVRLVIKGLGETVNFAWVLPSD